MSLISYYLIGCLCLAAARTGPADSQPALPAGPPAVATRPADDARLAVLNTGTLFLPANLPAGRPDLLIHFHGDPAVMVRNIEAAGLPIAAVFVNQPGLSAAYAAAMKDPTRFGRILEEALARTRLEHPGVRSWGRVCVSCFSAGYGAVREILRHPASFERIDGLLAADSIYAGYVGADGTRRVDPAHMDGFRRFAAEAAAGRKTFIVTHSQLVPGRYASTVETADDLIAWVGGTRRPGNPDDPGHGPFRIVSRCECGRFRVIGCAGDDGQAHMQHLRHIAVWLAALPWSKSRPDGP